MYNIPLSIGSYTSKVVQDFSKSTVCVVHVGLIVPVLILVDLIVQNIRPPATSLKKDCLPSGDKKKNARKRDM